MSLWINAARVVDGSGAPAFHAHVQVEGGLITRILPAHVAPPVASGDQVVDAAGRVLMPGFVDAHTHALFAGDRLDEFERALAGATYLEILAAGGGILSTVRALRAASEDQLTALLGERLRHMLREGTTSVEVKSGYGLTTPHELEMLRAIRRAARDFPGTLVPTALLGHALDPAEPALVDRVLSETLPAVHAEFPGIAVDAFCEHGAWSVPECRRLLSRARELGHPLRLHTDQFHALGGVELGLELDALSLDHLEAATPEGLARLARSGAYGVMLPVTGFHTDQRFAAGRTFLDLGGRLVLASNYNPGSSPSSSMPFVIALAVRRLGVTALEAIRAATSTPAALLGLADRGLVRAGARADLLLLRHRDERLLGYELGGNPVERVWVNGAEIV
ncbi:MAG TPA: imidazolonepropionase [Polyangiaceae bacterium]|jgi:imidazolonepropionase|nr:imidazolonepropionase [Polyangiaceae bacterium]